MKLFLSHKGEMQEKTATLKKELDFYGISGFVANVDIKPTEQWQSTIEANLQSMKGFVALITDGFHESLWANQEVGFAVCKGVPIIPVKLGKNNPCGFIGKFQALSCGWDNLVCELVKLLIKNEDVKEAVLDSFITAMENCKSWEDAEKLTKILPEIDKITDKQLAKIILVYNDNNQIYDSYGFSGKKPTKYGEGLAFHLKRIKGRNFILNRRGKIEEE